MHYFEEVYQGLQNTKVSHKNQEISWEEGVSQWVSLAKESKDKGGLLFFCGNGASATMAEHMSHDWFQNAQVNTTTCAETSHITAISNDLAYDQVFAYRIKRILSEKDILVTISSSGNSPNVVEAIKAGKEKGATAITLSGKSKENKSFAMGDLNFYVPLDTYGLVESAHAVLVHYALDAFLERHMGGRH